MPTPVQIRFSIEGLPDAMRGFDTMEKAMVRLERNGARAANDGAAARVQTSRREVDSRDKEFGKLAKETEKWEREATRATENEARRREQIVERSASMAGRFYAKQTAEEEREAKRRTSIVEREAAAQARAVEAAHKKISSAIGGAVVRGTGGSLGRMAGFGAAAFGVGGTILMADAMRGEFAAQKSAQQIVNAVTAGNGGVAPQGASVANILGQASAVSRETGIDKADIVKGSLSYARSAKGGDFNGLMQLMGTSAKISKVTGADIGELGEASGIIQSQNQKATPAQLKQLLLNVYAQAGQGSMGLVDAAKQFGTLGSTAPYYKGDQLENQTKLIGLSQFARQVGDAGEAGTFVKDIASEMGAANKKWRKTHGRDLVHTDAATGQFDGPDQLIEQVFRGTKGNISTIGDLMGQRGSRVFTAMAGTYQDASKAAGGGAKGEDAGIAAVLADMHKVSGATMSGGDLDKQFADTMSTSSEKIGAATNRIKEALDERFAPVVERLADKLPELLPKIEAIIDAGGKLAEWFISNPITGIGALIVGSVTKDLAGVAIGEGIKAAILASMSGSSALGLSGGIGGSATGAAGAAGGAAVVGSVVGVTAAFVAGGLVGKGMAESAGDADAAAGVANTAGTSQDVGGKRKTMSSSDIAARIAQLEEMRSHIGEPGQLRGGTVALANLVGGKDVRDAHDADLKAQLEQNSQAIKALTEELKTRKGTQFTTVGNGGSLTGPGHPAPVDTARGTNIGAR